MTAHRALLPDDRLHLQEGPIDLVIAAQGREEEVAAAYDQAARAFDGLLARLVEELPRLRRPVGRAYPFMSGPVARRMARAVWPHRGVHVTPMAAVAGAVADHVLERMRAGRKLRTAYVNDGGDIALHVCRGQSLRIGLVSDIEDPRLDGLATITQDSPVRGVATSGRGGRSFSLGIADAVTVLAVDAAAADAAATLIANAVDIDHPAILRRPARDLDADSDLGVLPVTVAVGDLEDAAVETALRAGAGEAERMRRAGLIVAAMLSLRGRWRVVGAPGVAEDRSRIGEG